MCHVRIVVVGSSGTLEAVPGELIVSLEEIRVALNRVLGAVERDHGPILRLPGDQYWTVPVAAAFDLDPDKAMTVGQLGDDVEAVRELSVSTDDDVVAPWQELEHVIGVLRAVERLVLP